MQQDYLVPVIPGKYDIIPLHNSDRGSFKRCRQYWDWNSPARQNLTVRADIAGVSLPLWIGTGIHYALESYYSPGIRRDPVESWKTWFDIQWNGGVVVPEWLDLVYDLEPTPIKSNPDRGSFGGHDYTPNEIALGYGTEKDPRGVLYQVRGLKDILPDSSPLYEQWEEIQTLGVEMMKFYKRYAEVHDDFDVVMAEHTFSIPIWDYENDCILKRVDTREQSPNYGKELEVHSRGRIDMIKRRIGADVLGIADHKTAMKIDEDLDEKLETDEQCTTYLYALQVEAHYYDLPHKGEPIEEVLYNVIRKAYPKPPTVLKDGYNFSINRQEESTTYEMLMEYINSYGEKQRQFLWPNGFSEKQAAYIDYLRDVGDEQFIIRKHVRRNQHELADAGYRMYLEAMDMLDPNVRIYKNLRNDWQCLKCQFRAPCIAKSSGDDWQQLIQDNYSVARDR